MTKTIKQGLNFSDLPMREMILILQRLSMRLLGELLSPPCSPGRVLPEKEPPELNGILTKKDVKILSQSQVWKVKHTQRRKTGKIPNNLREELPRALKKMVTKSIKGKVSANQWYIAFCNRIALTLGGTRGDILPDELWSVAAEAAWGSPDFQLSVTMKLNDWLKRMRILVPYEFPVVIFSPTTFWILIALTKVKPLKLTQWFSKKKRANLRVCRRFQQEAQWQMIKNEWAGFWDQWLIQLASQRWPTGFTQLERRLCKALISLPLLKSTKAGNLCKKKGILKLSLWPLVEKLFDQMDGIKRLSKSKKDYRRIILLNFAIPNWEKQIPVFFKLFKSTKKYIKK